MKAYENQSTCGQKSDLTKPLPHQINTNQSSTSNTFQYHQPSMNQPKEALPSDNGVCVTEVPMFAPMMIGIACLTANTSAPTKPTTILVLVDEDCTQDSGQNANHEAGNGIVRKGEQVPGHPYCQVH